MTADDFLGLLKSESDNDLLRPCLLDDVLPYVFDSDPSTWQSFRSQLAGELGIEPGDIRIIGSGRLGFSTKPGANLKRFNDRSDIDVVIINARVFDELWMALLQAAYPRPPFVQLLSGWIEARRNEVYTGWLTPLDVRIDRQIVGARAEPAVGFRTRWFNALKRASRFPPRRHEDITGRLYRTLRHAELYHLNSLAALRKSLEPI
jgi:hypothetical protein